MVVRNALKVSAIVLALAPASCALGSVNHPPVRVVAVAVGGAHSLALKSNGSVWSWGDNVSGQLGNGTTTNSDTPVPVSGLESLVVGIAGGTNHSLAVKSDGSVWAWGSNDRGQLGNGYTTNSTTPVRVSGLTGRVVAVAAGDSDSLALKSDGSVWAWGDDFQGQLGNGLYTDSRTPVPTIGLVTSVRAIAAGLHHSLALKSDGSVWAWGDNSFGDLVGHATEPFFISTPVPMSFLSSAVVSIAGGVDFSLASKSDGSVWAWGLNDHGQLGSAASSEGAPPAPVSGLGGRVVAVACGWGYSLARKSDGSVMAWGSNFGGELGNGIGDDTSAPVAVNGLGGEVVAIAGGNNHSLAIKSDGSVWAWGSNNYGELGNGTIQPEGGSNKPVAVSGL